MKKEKNLSIIKKEPEKGQFKKFLSGPKKFVFLALFLLLLGLFAWRTLGKKQPEPQYQTAAVERGMIVSSVSASGQVLSVNIMSANTKASGIVQEVYAKDGDYVRKGDRIMTIDLDLQGQQKYAQAWSSYLSAKNSLESAKATAYSLQATMFGKWDTFKELAESDEYSEENIANRNLPEYHIPEKEWLAAEAKYKNQQAAISQAQASLNNAWLSYLLSSPTVTAPTDGVVTSLVFIKGMNIGSLDTGASTSNQKVATIQTEGMPIVSVNLSEIDVSQVELEQKATITLDSIPDKTFTGKVVGADRIGSTTSGVTQYPAIIQLNSSSEQILPSLTATANIIIDSRSDVLLVPSGAVQVQDEESFVRILSNDQVQLVPVETGLVSDSQTEIISGLNEGDSVVTGTVSSLGSQGNGASPFGGGMGGMIRMVR